MFQCQWSNPKAYQYSDVIMSIMASQITIVSTVYLTVCSGPDQKKHQSSASLAFVWGIHRWPVNSPHKGSVTRKMFPLDDVIMSANVAPESATTWYISWGIRYALRIYISIIHLKQKLKSSLAIYMYREHLQIKTCVLFCEFCYQSGMSWPVFMLMTSIRE